MEFFLGLRTFIVVQLLFAIVLLPELFPSFWWLLLPIVALILTPRSNLKYTTILSVIFYTAVLAYGLLLDLCKGPGSCLTPFWAFPMWLMSLLIFLVIWLYVASRSD